MLEQRGYCVHESIDNQVYLNDTDTDSDADPDTIKKRSPADAGM